MNQLGFAISNIRTTEFAILEENFSGEVNAAIHTGIRIGANIDKHFISILFEVQFRSKKKTIIKLAVECAFDIEEKAFKSFFNKEDKMLSMPGALCRHLAVITIGTTRGILHEKLNETKFEDVLLPSVNVTDHIPGEVIVLKSK